MIFASDKRLDLPRAGKRADRLLLAADFAAARTEIDVRRANLAVHLRRRDAIGEKLIGIEIDANFSVDAAIALDAAHAFRRLQLALDDVVDVPGKLFERHAGRRRRKRQDRLPFDVDALDDGLIDRARQIGANFRNRVSDVVQRPIGIRLEPEFQDRRRQSVGERRRDVLDAGDVGDGRLR